MAVTLDLMEYANNAAAQAAYVSSETGGDPDLDVCTGGTATSVATATGREAPFAFDDDPATFWHTEGVGSPWWIKYDLGAAVTKTVNKYTIQARATTFHYWVDFKLQGSNNDADWDDLDTQTGQSFGNGEKKTYILSTPNATAYRYYRFLITSTQSNVNAEAAEIEMMEVVVLQCYSEDTIVEQGTYSLKGIAKKTMSLNDTLTRTVDPTIDLSGLYDKHLYIRASRTGSNIKIGIHDSGGVTTEVTPNIASANVWQEVITDISGVADGDKDIIDSIIITIVNADADNTFYLDDMFGMTVASRERSIVYDIFAYIERARNIVYDSILELSKTRDIVYDSVLELSKTRDILYDSVLELSKTRDIVYDSILELSKARDIVYDLILELSKERNIQYDLVLELSQARSILYNIYNLIQQLEKPAGVFVRQSRPIDGITKVDKPLGYPVKMKKPW